MRGDPVAKRARHWTRWRRRQLRDAWRRGSHLDLGGESTTAWLCSWQRSGSTILAEVLASAPGTRLIYEPANLPDQLFTGEAAALAPLPTAPGPELDAIEHALRGRVRGPWVDQLCDCHLVRRRVVKDVRAIGLLGTVCARHPTVGVVVLVRHPLSVARSAVALGWADPTAGSPETRLLDEVRRWTDLHGAALRAASASRALVVAYEHLVAAPDVTLDRVVAHLGDHHPAWRDVAIDRGRLARPSSTSFRRAGGRSAEEWIGDFGDLDRGVVAAAAGLLADAGLGHLYGEGPEPRCDPEAFARTTPVP